MMKPPTPRNEEQRLALLKRLRLLDTPLDDRFERITRLACKSLNVPISAVSLVDGERQWFKSIQGLNVSETPRDVAFCAYAIMENTPFVVSDAMRDERFRDNPLVTSDPSIRAYAGCPLDLGDGLRVGTLCAIDTKPRNFSAAELAVLEDLAAMVLSELQNVALSQGYIDLLNELDEAQRAALIDRLTRLWNRAGGEDLLAREWEIAVRQTSALSIALLDIDHFKKINDGYGHDVGDQALIHVGTTVLGAVRPYDIVCRWGGEEFLLICPGCDKTDLPGTLERVLQAIRQTSFQSGPDTIPVTASLGAVVARPARGDRIDDCVKRADKALYEAKNGGRDRYVIAAS